MVRNISLPDEDVQLLEAFADGGKKTYVHICRFLGVPVTPGAPTATTQLCRPLVRAGLIERAGLLRAKYRITSQGRAALAHRDTHDRASAATAAVTPQRQARQPTWAPPPSAAAPVRSTPSADERGPARDAAPDRAGVSPVGDSKRALIPLWLAGIVLFPLLKVVLSGLGVPPPFVMATWAPVLFILIVGTVRICCGHVLDLRSLVPLSLLTLPAGLVGLFALGMLAELFGGKGDPVLIPGFLLGIAIVIVACSAHAMNARSRSWVREVGGQSLGEPDVPREKHVGFGYLLLTMFGLFGGHRYYLGMYPTAILYTFSLGLVFIGAFVDFFRLPALTRRANERIWMQWFKRREGEWVTIEGTARDVGGREWRALENRGGAVMRTAIQFRVEEHDESGDIVRRVPVEVVGISFTGSLRDGDTIRLTGKRSAENIVRTLAVDNLSTGSKVIASFL